MIDLYLVGDIKRAVKYKCIENYGGRRTWFGSTMSSQAQKKYREVLSKPISEILEFLRT